MVLIHTVVTTKRFYGDDDGAAGSRVRGAVPRPTSIYVAQPAGGGATRRPVLQPQPKWRHAPVQQPKRRRLDVNRGWRAVKSENDEALGDSAAAAAAVDADMFDDAADNLADGDADDGANADEEADEEADDVDADDGGFGDDDDDDSDASVYVWDHGDHGSDGGVSSQPRQHSRKGKGNRKGKGSRRRGGRGTLLRSLFRGGKLPNPQPVPECLYPASWVTHTRDGRPRVCRWDQGGCGVRPRPPLRPLRPQYRPQPLPMQRMQFAQ